MQVFLVERECDTSSRNRVVRVRSIRVSKEFRYPRTGSESTGRSFSETTLCGTLALRLRDGKEETEDRRDKRKKREREGEREREDRREKRFRLDHRLSAFQSYPSAASPPFPFRPSSLTTLSLCRCRSLAPLFSMPIWSIFPPIQVHVFFEVQSRNGSHKKKQCSGCQERDK